MRTIKFRGKDEHGCWHIGWLAETNDGTIYIIENDESWTDDGFHNDDFSGWYKVLEKTVGQFTGLLDKNGKEIYEGDIIKIEDEGVVLKPKVVDFSNGMFGTREWSLAYYGEDIIEVIGNIHDNPELLKE